MLKGEKRAALLLTVYKKIGSTLQREARLVAQWEIPSVRID